MTEPSLIQAQEQFTAALPNRSTGSERCPLAEALGRTLYGDVPAPHDAPPYPRAIVEGFLVHTVETRAASEASPVTFRVAGAIRPGDTSVPAIGPGEGWEVATGSMVPDGPFSIVRMWEAKREQGVIHVSRPFPPRFFIEEQGADHKKGDAVLAAGTLITPSAIGLVASFGIDEVSVARRPRVTVFASGDEVVPYTGAMHPGAIRDCNTPMLSAAIRQAGGVPVSGGIMKDDFAAFCAAAKQALAGSDMLVIAGGTAVGGRDFMSDLMRELGHLVVDGVPMKSGRPLIMGVADGKPMVCVAGHPPEALRGFALFGVAALDRLLGRTAPLPGDPAAAS